MDDILPTESVTGRRGVAPYDLLYELHDKYEFAAPFFKVRQSLILIGDGR